MSFNVNSKQSVVLDGFGGIVSLSNPTDLSEGSSPRTHDSDFLVGSVSTRPGTESVYSYQGQQLGPNSGTLATDVNLGGQPWSNVSGILGSGSPPGPASVQLGIPQVQTVAPASSSATATLTVKSGLASYPPPSPPFTSVVRPLTAANSQIILSASGFLFSVPQQSLITGMGVSFTASGVGTASASISIQFTQNGLVVGGLSQPVTLTSVPTVYTIGNASILWNANWNPGIINMLLGVNVTASVSGAVGTSSAFSVSGLTATAYYIAPTVSDGLQVTGFNFPAVGSPPLSQGVTGIQVSLTGYSAVGSTVSAQLVKNGVAVGTPMDVVLGTTPASFPLGSSTNTWNSTLFLSDLATLGVILTASGSSQVFLSGVTMAAFQTSGLCNFNYVKTFETSNGVISTLALDATGQWWQEEVNSDPGVLSTIPYTVTSGSYAKSCTQFEHEYICVSNLLNGTDIPRQYTLTTNNRVSQVAPGISPTVTAVVGGQSIVNITQYAPYTFPEGGFPYNSWQSLNSGSGNTPGNVGSIFLRVGLQLPVTLAVGDNIVLSGMNGLPGIAGNPTFNNSTGIGGANPPYWTVSYVQTLSPPFGGPETYLALQFTSTLTGASSGDNHISSGTLQQTLATVTTAAQVSNLQVGGQFTVFGNTQAPYNNTWSVVNSLNAAQIDISQTQLTSGVAYFDYTLVTGTTPVAGQYLTTNSLVGGNGIFNITNVQITSVSPSVITVNLPGYLDVGPTPEVGTGLTAGTIFQFDTVQDVPSTPVVGTGTGGTLTVAGNIAAGTRLAVVMFLTEDDYLTPASMYPTVFTTSTSDSAITFTGVPIGPPNTIARWIAITEAGANGIPGANFYVIPNPVTVLGTTYGPSVINDNVSTSLTLSFTESILLLSEEIDLPGANQLALVELGSSAWNISYAGRMFYGLEQSKVENFNNLTFDGGYLPVSGIVEGSPAELVPGNVIPAGWLVDLAVPYNGNLNVSSIFGNSYYVVSTTNPPSPYDSGILTAGAGTDNGVPPFWVNPSNVTSATLFATAVPTSVPTDGLIANTFPLGVPPTAVIQGIAVTMDSYYSDPFESTGGTGVMSVQLLVNGIPYGAVKTFDPTHRGVIGTTTLGGSADLWGAAWTPSFFPANTNFGVQMIATQPSGATYTFGVRNVRVEIFGTVGTALNTRIQQGAFQDYYSNPITAINTLYSVRMSARIPSGATAGSIVVDLWSKKQNTQYGQFVVPLSSLSATFSTVVGTLLTTPLISVPPDLQIRLYGMDMAMGADFEIDRIEVFPTLTPLLGSDVRVSYFDNPCAFDGVTGLMGLDEQNTQNCYGAAIVLNALYFLKESSIFTTSVSSNQEPSSWGVQEVSNKVGTCGIFSYDYGEEWFVTACRRGIYIFSGGQPMPISNEIFQIWDKAVNWDAGHTIAVRNDLINERLLVAIPMKTPNFWLPDAPANANPQSPNVILVCSYHGLDSVGEIENGPQQHVTMFGTLASLDMHRKWTLWQIPTPYMDFVKQPDDLTETLYVCNGIGSSKIYQFEDEALSDDGQPIPFSYTTYPLVDSTKAKEYPLMGFERKLYTYFQILASGTGSLDITCYPNSLNLKEPFINPNAYSIPNPIAVQGDPDDYNRPLNVAGNRMFVEFSSNAVGSSVTVSKLILGGSQHPWLRIRPTSQNG